MRARMSAISHHARPFSVLGLRDLLPRNAEEFVRGLYVVVDLLLDRGRGGRRECLPYCSRRISDSGRLGYEGDTRFGSEEPYERLSLFGVRHAWLKHDRDLLASSEEGPVRIYTQVLYCGCSLTFKPLLLPLIRDVTADEGTSYTAEDAHYRSQDRYPPSIHS
jgi:hypothetical protein